MNNYRKPYRIKKQRKIFNDRLFWFFILFLIVLGGCSYFFIFSNFFSIKKIVVKGEEGVSTKDIELLIKRNLGKRFLFFEIKNILWVDFKRLEEIILTKFPNIAKIEIDRNFPDTISVSLSERKSAVIYCQSEQCFSVDNEGVVFEISPEDSKENSKLTKIKSFQMREELKFGDKVLDKELLDKIIEIDNIMNNDLKIKVNEFLIISEQRINIKTVEEWEVYLNPKKKIDLQLAKLAIILKNKIDSEKRKNLKYIDLRFDKVYISPAGLIQLDKQKLSSQFWSPAVRIGSTRDNNH